MTTGKGSVAVRTTAVGRRDQLLDAARAEFIRSGFAGATTKTIAGAAGITEDAMYRLFPSKEKLFEESVCDPLERLVLQMAALATRLGPDDAGINPPLDPTVQAQLLELMSRTVPLFGAATLTQEAGPAYYQRRIAPLFDIAIKAVADLLRHYPNAGVEAEVLYFAIFGMQMGLAIEAARLGVDLDVATLSTAIVQLLTSGLVGS